jgi:hypothetical protein
MQGHILDNHLISMIISSYDTLQDFFTKFKAFLLQLKACKIDKDGDQLILTIVSNLGPNFLVFISTFHTSRITI